MGERNASASAFGWDFQANAAIFLMLENIKQAKNVRVEGADEDIEITLLNNEKFFFPNPPHFCGGQTMRFLTY